MRKPGIMLLSLLLLSGGAARAQELSLSTNLMGYANLGTMNLEASYAPARHWSLNAAVRYNPFSLYLQSKDMTVRNRQRTVNLGARFWPWHIYSGWWLSPKLQYQEYNTTGFRSDMTSEGDRLGMSLSGGYSYMLGTHLNIEFGLGVWGGYDSFVNYDCPTCGRVASKGEKIFVLPDDVILALMYVF